MTSIKTTSIKTTSIKTTSPKMTDPTQAKSPDLQAMPRITEAGVNQQLESFWLPLYGRSLETLREDALLCDPLAVQWVQKIERDWKPYTHRRISQLAYVLRSSCFDQMVTSFLQICPNAQVINVGAGLCTRLWRVDNGQLHWYDVDTFAAIRLRQRLVKPCDRLSLLPRLSTDLNWVNQIAADNARPTLVVMEGVSMYQSEAQNQDLFQALQQRFGRLQVLMDVIHPKFVPPFASLEQQLSEGTFQWGLAEISDLNRWKNDWLKLQVISVHEYLCNMIHYPARLEPWMTHFPQVLSPLLKDSAQIIQLQLG